MPNTVKSNMLKQFRQIWKQTSRKSYYFVQNHDSVQIANINKHENDLDFVA